MLAVSAYDPWPYKCDRPLRIRCWISVWTLQLVGRSNLTLDEHRRRNWYMTITAISGNLELVVKIAEFKYYKNETQELKKGSTGIELVSTTEEWGTRNLEI